LKEIIFDTETTTFLHGSYRSRRNYLCSVGIRCVEDGKEVGYINLDFLDDPHPQLIATIQKWFDWADIIIGFNLKFDLHWVRKQGVVFEGKRLWDVQVVHFVLTYQKEVYPSLNGVAEQYGMGTKLDVVKTEYWDNGIDTPDIPKYILAEYLEQDVNLTYLCYLYQKKALEKNKRLSRLVSLCNQDLEVLEEMEWNGIYFDSKRSVELGNELAAKIEALDERLRALYPDIPVNWGSTDHISALIYGGVITLDYQEPIGFYKTGQRAGQEKLGWKEKKFVLERLAEPLPRTEVKDTAKYNDEELKTKKGYRVYKTDEKTLLSLKVKGKAKEVIECILKRSEYEKLRGTYYHGFPALVEKKDWEPNMLYGNFNQVVTRTGRLSSSDPNLQNEPPEMDALIMTRF